jgi:hypothetical protein
MTKLFFAALIAFSAIVPDAQPANTWIVVKTFGTERASFVPREMPYFQGGPSVSVYLIDQRSRQPRDNVRLQDGLIVTGFEFIGWTEGDRTRVQVFALVPSKDAPNTYMPGGKPELLQRRDFASYQISRGDSVAIDEMTALNIEPMVLSAENR